jgi:choline dehydrogenase-like flavoprotein
MPAATFESDLEELGNASRKVPFDAIVVGGGSSGLTVAHTLSERGASVLLLEAGPAPFLTHVTNTDLRFARQLLRNLRDSIAYRPRLAGGGEFGVSYGCLGGRGLFWNGASPRFSRFDFEGWPDDGLPEEADYVWGERQFRVSIGMGRTPMAERIIAKLSNASFTAEPGPFAADIDDLYTGRLSAGIASGLGMFLRGSGHAVARGQLRVAINSRVHMLLMDGDVLCGVTVIRGKNGGPIEVFSRTVVLCAGALESAKLAAVSSIPDQRERIGKGIQEHLFYQALLDAPDLYDRNSRSSAIVYQRSWTQDGHQWEIHAPGNRLFALDDGTPWAPDATPPYEIMIRSFAATEKRDDNFLEATAGALGSSTLHFTLSAADEAKKKEVAADAARLCGALGATAAVPPALDSVERFRPLGSSYHEAGGLDMGLDPATSVTAPDGRFHSLSNLVSADAAAFPRIGASNPHLTIVAIARRKARLLADRLATSR